MKKYGIPEKIVRIVKIFYGDFKCAVGDQGEICEWFVLDCYRFGNKNNSWSW